jgi:hypothetical protein
MDFSFQAREVEPVDVLVAGGGPAGRGIDMCLEIRNFRFRDFALAV